MNELMDQIAAEKEKSTKLKLALDEEKILRVKAETSLHELRKVHEKMAVKGEMEEEKIVNKLLSKINEVQHDKGKLAIDLEREEECLTNNLQRQLRQVGLEKEVTDAEVEDLKRQLEDMKTEREKIARLVEAEQELLSNNLFRKLQKAMAEKLELEHQLSRSTSCRSSRSSSISLTGVNANNNYISGSHEAQSPHQLHSLSLSNRVGHEEIASKNGK